MNLTIEQLFGKGSYQNSNQLVINKNALRGLNINLNSPQSLLAAIINNAFDNFFGVVESENDIPITDENNKPISYDNSDLYELLIIEKWRTQVINGKIIITFLLREYQLKNEA